MQSEVARMETGQGILGDDLRFYGYPLFTFIMEAKKISISSMSQDYFIGCDALVK